MYSCLDSQEFSAVLEGGDTHLNRLRTARAAAIQARRGELARKLGNSQCPAELRKSPSKVDFLKFKG